MNVIESISSSLIPSVNTYNYRVDSIFATTFGIDWPVQNRSGDELCDTIVAMLHIAQTREQNWCLQPSQFYRFSKLKREEDAVYGW